MAACVLVVEDDAAIRELVVFHLTRAGMQPVAVATGAAARQEWQRLKPDAVILDLMLPDGSGWDLCRELREQGPALGRPAVIMLTALDDEAERVAGLELGADDYVTKPFSPRELVARVRAVLRRREAPSAGPIPPEDPEVIHLGDVVVDRRRVEVTVAGKPLQLTATEFRILAALAEAGGEVCSRDRLLDTVWGQDFFGDRRTVDVHIRHIREKLETAGVPERLETVRGFGYRLKDGPET